MMSGAHKQAKKATASKNRQKQQSHQSQTQRSGSKKQDALLARQGIQGRNFLETLANKRQQSGQQVRQEAASRTSEHDDAREVRAQGERVQERQEMDANERVQSIRDEEGGGQSGEGSTEGGSGMGQSAHGGQQSALGAGESSIPHGVVEAGMVGASPKIAPEVIQQIVRQVLVGVNKQGLGTVHIDFKGSELEGTSMSIEADGNKIYAKVFTDNRNLGRRFKASHTELARALGQANLSLESLEVMGAG